jgi:cyclase
MHIELNKIELFNYRKKLTISVSEEIKELISSGTVSEVLLQDWKNEGRTNGFDTQIVENFPIKDVPLILFGGLSHESQISKLLEIRQVVAVGVGNFLSYKEHSIQTFREKINSHSLRNPVYTTEDSL